MFCIPNTCYRACIFFHSMIHTSSDFAHFALLNFPQRYIAHSLREEFKSSQILSSIIRLNCTLRDIIVKRPRIFFNAFIVRVTRFEVWTWRMMKKNRGVLPSFLFGLYHPQRRIVTGSRNAGPGMNAFPGSQTSLSLSLSLFLSLSRSKLYRSIRFSCYTLAGQKTRESESPGFLWEIRYGSINLTGLVISSSSCSERWHILREDSPILLLDLDLDNMLLIVIDCLLINVCLDYFNEWGFEYGKVCNMD